MEFLRPERFANVAGFAIPRADRLDLGHVVPGTPCAHHGGMGVRRFTELRAWQVCDVYKKAVYRLCSDGPLSKDWKRRSQLEESVSGPPGHVAEGFGRFNRYITEEVRLEHDTLAEAALEQVTGLMEYLQSPEALRNARRARERRIASRPERQAKRTLNPEPEHEPEPEPEPGTEPEHEPSSEKPEE